MKSVFCVLCGFEVDYVAARKGSVSEPCPPMGSGASSGQVERSDGWMANPTHKTALLVA